MRCLAFGAFWRTCGAAGARPDSIVHKLRVLALSAPDGGLPRAHPRSRAGPPQHALPARAHAPAPSVRFSLGGACAVDDRPSVGLHGTNGVRLPQHHFSHAAYALYTSPFEQPFIVSYDGGGQEGAFNIYRGERLPRLRRDWAHPSALPVAFCVGAHMRCLILCANVRVCASRCVHSL